MQKLIEEFLTKNSGYIKKSPYKVAERLNLNANYDNIFLIKEIMKNLRKEKYKLIPNTITHTSGYLHVIPNSFTPNKEYLTKLALESFIESGNYDKAIDFINKIKQDKITPQYKKQNYLPGNYIVLGCLHFPFVNKEFFNSVIELIKDCPDLKGIILAGDILDMSSISRHNKGLMPVLGYDLEREYKESNQYLDLIDKAIGSRKIVKEYFSGNHEDWYYQWKKDVDNSKLGGAGPLSPYDACFKKRGYSFQKDWKNARVKIGDLEIIHGIFTTVTSAQKHLNALKRNVLFFHTHRFNTHIEGSLEAFNCGWGGDKDAPVFGYMTDFQKETWRNGMAVVNLTESGLTNITTIPFKEGLFFNNKLY